MNGPAINTGIDPIAPAAPVAPAEAATAPPGTDLVCLHCGQTVFQVPFLNPRGEAFCCEGCLQVHAILGPEGRGRYYGLLAQSGQRAPRANLKEDYLGFLESLREPGTLAAIGRWNGRRHGLSLESREITCAACAWLLENILGGIEGIHGFEVDFPHGEIFLEYDADTVELRSILERIARFGYPLRPKSATAPGHSRPERSLLYRLAISAACFANSMAFSLAVYLGAFESMPRRWMSLFGVLGFLLSLPAVLYCAHPFYSGAWRAARGRRFNVDVTVTLGILLSFGISAASALGGGDSNFSDSLTGLIFFLVLGRWGVRRFEAGLALKGRWFEALRPGKVRVRRRGGIELIDWEEVKAGETIEVLAGSYLPLDGILDAPEAWMDTSLLTGESRAVRFGTGDGVFAGYLNLRGRIGVRVTGGGGATRILALGRELEALAQGRRPQPDGTGAVAKWFTLAVAACAILAAVLNAGEGPLHAMAVSASVFIISCSCALALAAPISRGLGLRRAKAMGFHFRAQTTLEAVQDVRCILFDKTGTLTFTHRNLSSLKWLAPFDRDVTARKAALAWLKALAGHSLHPVSLSLHRALEAVEDGHCAFASVREIAHFGMVGRSAEPGFGEVCLCRFGAWNDGDGAFAGLGYPKPVLPAFSAADPIPETCLFIDGRLAALIRFTEEIKPEVRELVSGLGKRGVTVALLSGDNQDKVAAFSGACGIRNFHAALSPEDKRRLAAEYRHRHGRCLAVGDGFNDSLLFGESDLAMAVEGGAVDLLSGIDILSTGNTPSRIMGLLGLSRAVRRSIRLSFWVSGFYNALAVALALNGSVTPLLAAILMPVSSLSLCLIAYLAIPKAPPLKTA